MKTWTKGAGFRRRWSALAWQCSPAVISGSLLAYLKPSSFTFVILRVCGFSYYVIHCVETWHRHVLFPPSHMSEVGAHATIAVRRIYCIFGSWKRRHRD